jgi:hypothetical protein
MRRPAASRRESAANPPIGREYSQRQTTRRRFVRPRQGQDLRVPGPIEVAGGSESHGRRCSGLPVRGKPDLHRMPGRLHSTKRGSQNSPDSHIKLAALSAVWRAVWFHHGESADSTAPGSEIKPIFPQRRGADWHDDPLLSPLEMRPHERGCRRTATRGEGTENRLTIEVFWVVCGGWRMSTGAALAERVSA